MTIPRALGGAAALAAFAGAALVFAGPARGFDIQGSPATVANPAANITDTFLFPSPTNPNDVVVALDVNPLIAPGNGPSTFFPQSILYTMHFDTKYANEAVGVGRPVDNVVIQFAFGAAASGTQTVNVFGPAVPNETGTTTSLVNSGATSGTGFFNRPFSFTTTAGTVEVFAGPRRDPAFWNASSSPATAPGDFFQIFPDRNQGSTAASCLPGAANTCPNGFSNPGTNTFANSNVLSVVVELPKALLETAGNTNVVGYWATSATTTGS